MRKAVNRILFLTLISSSVLPGCGFLRDKLKPEKNKSIGTEGPATKPQSPEDPASGTSPQEGTLQTQTSPLGLRGALISFENCAAVEEHIESRLISSMRRQIQQQITWIEREDLAGGATSVAVPMAAGPVMAKNASTEQMDTETPSPDSAGSDQSGPDDYTTTNNQVAGVEEPDFIKNNDRHIYHVTRGKLRILKSWPANELSLLSETKLSGRPFELLLDDEGKRLVVLSNPPYDPTTANSASSDDRISRSPFGGMIIAKPDVIGGGNWDFSRVDVTSFDITDPAKPVAMHSYRLAGTYHSARRVGTGVRIVLQGEQRMPDGISYYDEANEQYDSMGNYIPKPKAARIAGLQKLMRSNEELIRSKTLAWWLDSQAFVKIDQNAAQAPILDLGECKTIHAPNVDTAMGLTHIASLDLATGSLRDNILLAQVAGIYASTNSLYLTTAYDWWDYEHRDVDYTYVHKFDIQKTDSTNYLGSGSVAGSLINQFAMDEHDGHLRVATTVQHYCQLPDEMPGVVVGQPVIAVGASQPMVMPSTTSQANLQLQSPSCPPADQRLYSQVTVLAQGDNQLMEVGKTPPMAPSERIYSVRFAQTRGYVVTFRQVDPLFTLELADPKNPRIVGELKVPGYSTYIHMVDDKTLLTIGRDATDEGRVRGLKLSLFDVSDMAKPTELHSLALQDNFWSEAETNHKAFNFFRAKDLLAIPVTGHRSVNGTTDVWWGEFVSALKIYKVDTANGIREIGELSMNDIYNSSALRDEAWWFSGAGVQRSIIADNFIYAISDLGIRSANLEQLASPLATVRYPCDRDCFEQWWNW